MTTAIRRSPKKAYAKIGRIRVVDLKLRLLEAGDKAVCRVVAALFLKTKLGRMGWLGRWLHVHGWMPELLLLCIVVIVLHNVRF